jgi:hypothetical protein
VCREKRLTLGSRERSIYRQKGGITPLSVETLSRGVRCKLCKLGQKMTSMLFNCPQKRPMTTQVKQAQACADAHRLRTSPTPPAKSVKYDPTRLLPRAPRLLHSFFPQTASPCIPQ